MTWLQNHLINSKYVQKFILLGIKFSRHSEAHFSSQNWDTIINDEGMSRTHSLTITQTNWKIFSCSLWCINMLTWRDEQRADVVVRAGTGYRKPRCISHPERFCKTRTAVFSLQDDLADHGHQFFYNNHALLRLTPQLHLPLLLFTSSSRQYFSFTEDLNTWLSGSTLGAKYTFFVCSF